MSMELERRRSTLDLTRAPDEQWNEEMMQLVAATVLKRAATRGEQIYCLAVADALDLNPFIDEIYFLPTKSTDGSGPGIKPYIGRNGLVKKATDRGYYYESDTVHENDKFRILRGRDGERTCTHSYTQSDRGEIVGAYAFLHRRGGGEVPAFFYAKLSEYLPTFDAEWKMGKSPWGNQRSAMIEKCAMIGSGRKRLDLGNVLMDGEVERFVQQQAVGPPAPEPTEPAEFDLDALGSPEVVGRLRVAIAAANRIREGAWTPAKIEMVTAGMGDHELAELAEKIEADNDVEAAWAADEAGDVPEAAEKPERPGDDAGAAADEEIVADAEVVFDPLTDEEAQRADALRRRIADLILLRDGGAAETEQDKALLDEEIEKCGAELAAISNPDQGSLDEREGQ